VCFRESPDLVEHFLLSFFRDELLELRHDLVAPRHHGFHFIFGEIMLGFVGQHKLRKCN